MFVRTSIIYSTEKKQQTTDTEIDTIKHKILGDPGRNPILGAILYQ